MCFRAEEELLLFCVRVSMLSRSMKEENNEDAFQTLNRQALQKEIRLSHLSEGSAILSVCHIHAGEAVHVFLSSSLKYHTISVPLLLHYHKFGVGKIC